MRQLQLAVNTHAYVLSGVTTWTLGWRRVRWLGVAVYNACSYSCRPASNVAGSPLGPRSRSDSLWRACLSPSLLHNTTSRQARCIQMQPKVTNNEPPSYKPTRNPPGSNSTSAAQLMGTTLHMSLSDAHLLCNVLCNVSWCLCSTASFAQSHCQAANTSTAPTTTALESGSRHAYTSNMVNDNL